MVALDDARSMRPVEAFARPDREGMVVEPEQLLGADLPAERALGEATRGATEPLAKIAVCQ